MQIGDLLLGLFITSFLAFFIISFTSGYLNGKSSLNATQQAQISALQNVTGLQNDISNNANSTFSSVFSTSGSGNIFTSILGMVYVFGGIIVQLFSFIIFLPLHIGQFLDLMLQYTPLAMAGNLIGMFISFIIYFVELLLIILLINALSKWSVKNENVG